MSDLEGTSEALVPFSNSTATVIMTRIEFCLPHYDLARGCSDYIDSKGANKAAMHGTVGALFPQRDCATVPIRLRLVVQCENSTVGGAVS